MNTTAPRPETAAGDFLATDRTRFRAALSAVLFVPAALAVGAVTFASEGASRCVTYGEKCGSSLPGWLFAWVVGLGAVSCLVALAAPAVRVRRMAFTAQLLAECAALLVILSHA